MTFQEYQKLVDKIKTLIEKPGVNQETSMKIKVLAHVIDYAHAGRWSHIIGVLFLLRDSMPEEVFKVQEKSRAILHLESSCFEYAARHAFWAEEDMIGFTGYNAFPDYLNEIQDLVRLLTLCVDRLEK